MISNIFEQLCLAWSRKTKHNFKYRWDRWSKWLASIVKWQRGMHRCAHIAIIAHFLLRITTIIIIFDGSRTPALPIISSLYMYVYIRRIYNNMHVLHLKSKKNANATHAMLCRRPQKKNISHFEPEKLLLEHIYVHIYRNIDTVENMNWINIKMI